MKSETERKFDELSEKYYKKFKKNYPYMITSGMTLAEACADMEKCIEKGKAKKDYPYKEGAEY